MITLDGAAALLNGLVGKAQGGILGSSCYMGLSTTTPNADGTNFTEPTHASYARTIIGLYNQSATQVMGTPANKAIENDKIIYFPESTGDWGTVTYFGLFTAQSGGKPLIYGVLTEAIEIDGSETPVVPLFRVGNFTLSIS